MTDWLLPALFGFGAGILSAWGVGGGTLLLLCMTLFLGVDQREAQAINLLFFLPTAGISLFFHKSNGYLDRPVWRKAALPGAAASLAAALLSLRWDPSALRIPFGLFLLWAGGTVLRSALKTKKPEEDEKGRQGEG